MWNSTRIYIGSNYSEQCGFVCTLVPISSLVNWIEKSSKLASGPCLQSVWIIILQSFFYHFTQFHADLILLFITITIYRDTFLSPFSYIFEIWIINYLIIFGMLLCILLWKLRPSTAWIQQNKMHSRHV